MSSWYKEGLHFGCTACGACCTGAPGYVWLTEEDISLLSKHLNLSEEAFLRRYTRQVGKKISLLEDPATYACIFLKSTKCSLYDARPKQCRTFPFWPSILKSQKNWDEAAKSCEGINHKDAPLLTEEEILDRQ
ncbi:MAG: YkgJ family cysteine cluster protein [Simkaniaceae bacterium]